jgi:hypothetical protein
MYSAPLEKTVPFPQVRDARRGEHRFRLSGLYAPFEDLGGVALSALHNNDGGIVSAGEATLEFLGKVTRFIVGNGDVQQGRREACAPGNHTFEHQFISRKSGLAAARRGLSMVVGEYPVSRLVVGYSVPHDRGSTAPVGSVQVRVDLDGHPQLAGHYARVSGSISLEEAPICILRGAIGDVTHQGLLVPDVDPSIEAVASMAAKLEDVQGLRAG